MKSNFLLSMRVLSLFSVFLIFFALSSFGQKEDLFTIEWLKPKVYTQGEKKITVPNISGQSLDGNRPNFYWIKPVSAGANYKLDLQVTGTEPALSAEIKFLNDYHIKVDVLDYELAVSNANTDKFVVLNLFPFIRKQGQIYRITDFKIIYSKGVSHPPVAQKSFVANSVLADGSGTWYKISVNQDGVYKIDKAFLESCGIDVSSINPQDINIYGNGEGRLPELNSVYRTDDLAKNDILIVGEGDGVFDDNDYILFYGWGPHRWYVGGPSWLPGQKMSFNQDRNPYSDASFYFININAADPPARIQSINDAAAAATHTVNTYDYYDVHEQDLYSLVNGGQRWYGELFDTQLQRQITFNVPDLDVSSPVNFEVTLAANSSGGSANNENYTIGGTSLFSANLPMGDTENWGRTTRKFSWNTPGSSIPLLITVSRNSPDILTYLDRVLINARRNLRWSGSQFNFRDSVSAGIGNVAEYTVADFPATGFIWEISDRHAPKLINGTVVGTDYVFRQTADTLREYVAVDGSNFLVPSRVGSVDYQNLHGLDQADMLIVSHKSFLYQADRLANLHRNQGLTVHVVSTEQVFNEFSSGGQDATAIKTFAKMFYDRGAIDPTTRPKSLLLFGDGTYDPKNRVDNNNNYLVTYQVVDSEGHISALVTDDYYGLLDDNESISSADLLDLGVGRLLISDNDMAKQQVDKVQHYMENGSNLYNTQTTHCSSDDGSSTFGDWRTKFVQIGDDEEYGYFLVTDCEPQYDTVSTYHPEINIEKIYLDAHQQVTTAGGQRYPDVNTAIDDVMERGALVVNYIGHGGEVGVAEERVITVPQIQDWKNIDNLPLLVTATCEFTKYDDPDRVSAGEWASINPYGGAIALMTTTRSVFFGVNSDTGKSFVDKVFKRDANFQPLTFGEIIMETKNAVIGGSNNKRSFTLIGDPALQIALPRMNIVTDSINGYDPAIVQDTIRALSHVTIKGHMEDFTGNTLSSFNGVVYPTVYDKPKMQETLLNDPDSSPVPGVPIQFETQTNKLYKGKASITNGYFEFSFIVPKDINYSYDLGKISYYGENGSTDGIGFDKRVYVGGIDPNGLNDSQGPDIELHLNDESFVNGGITDQTPILIAKLFDENGINAVGNGVGHDLLAVLDGETGSPIVLNDYYSADLDSYQSGEVRYNFSELEPGSHVLNLKAWDVNNNSAEASLEFVVQEGAQLALDHVLNYPNPFTTHTDFYFEHNLACEELETQIQIFTVSGKLIKTINEVVHTDGFRSDGIAWDGRDDFGDQIGKGVYIYRLKVTSPTGGNDEKLEKLVILK